MARLVGLLSVLLSYTSTTVNIPTPQPQQKYRHLRPLIAKLATSIVLLSAIHTASGQTQDETNKQPPSNSSSAADKLAITGQVFDIITVILSFIILAVMGFVFYVRRDIALRSSFRLSGSIAIANIIFGITQFLYLNNKYMESKSKSPASLRLIIWFMAASNMASLFLISCIATQLFLTFVTNRYRLALGLHKLYEIISWTMAFILTHPILYIGDTITWNSRLHRHELTGKSHVIDAINWLFYRVPIIFGVVYCFAMSGLVATSLRPVQKRAQTIYNKHSGSPSQGLSGRGGNANGHRALYHGTSLMVDRGGPAGIQAQIQKQMMYQQKQQQERNHRGNGSPTYLMSPSDGLDSSTTLNSYSNHENTKYENGNGKLPITPTTTTTTTRAMGPNGGGVRGIDMSTMITWTTWWYHRQLKFAIVRVMTYPLIPLLTQMFPLIISCLIPATKTPISPLTLGESSKISPALYVGSMIPLSLVGIINFVQFLLNPVFDPIWSWLKACGYFDLFIPYIYSNNNGELRQLQIRKYQRRNLRFGFKPPFPWSTRLRSMSSGDGAISNRPITMNDNIGNDIHARGRYHNTQLNSAATSFYGNNIRPNVFSSYHHKHQRHIPTESPESTMSDLNELLSAYHTSIATPSDLVGHLSTLEFLELMDMSPFQIQSAIFSHIFTKYRNEFNPNNNDNDDEIMQELDNNYCDEVTKRNTWTKSVITHSSSDSTASSESEIERLARAFRASLMI